MGARLAKRDWPELLKEYEFFLAKNQPSYALPDDYGRLISKTGWDKAQSRPLTPISAQDWQEWKSGAVSPAIWKQYRIKAEDGDRRIFIHPTPTTTSCTFETRDGRKVKVGLVVEYYTKNWAETTSGSGISTLSAGTDVPKIPSDVIEAELKWRWLRSLSRAYADEKFEAEQLISTSLAQSGVPTSLRADQGRHSRYPNIPETGIGL